MLFGFGWGREEHRQRGTISAPEIEPFTPSSIKCESTISTPPTFATSCNQLMTKVLKVKQFKRPLVAVAQVVNLWNSYIFSYNNNQNYFCKILFSFLQFCHFVWWHHLPGKLSAASYLQWKSLSSLDLMTVCMPLATVYGTTIVNLNCYIFPLHYEHAPSVRWPPLQM